MKIKEIVLREEDATTTVKAISGDEAELSNGQKIPAKTLTPDPDHPGQYSAPSMNPDAIKPGAVVNTDTSTSEEVEDDEEHPGLVHYNDWMNSEHAPHDSDSGDDEAVFHKAIHFLHGKGVHPGDIEFHAHHMAHKFHGGMEEEHEEDDQDDTMAHGNHDVGGDGTDDFINDIRDKEFERSAEGDHDGSMSPLSEDDVLLQKMLTIAGLK